MIGRRGVLQALGVCITLPVFESAVWNKTARAEGAVSKKRFIGCFFGSGAPMPGAGNGDWGYSGRLGGALKPLTELAVATNVSVLRGFRAVNNFDNHWSGTAGFLSSNMVGTSAAGAADPAYSRCAKSFDQFIADLSPASRIRSLHAGCSDVPSWDAAHDGAGSIKYVNSIAWRDANNPISNTNDPLQMFAQVFGAGGGGGAPDPRMLYLLKRKQSILDGVLDQYKNHSAQLSVADRNKLASFAQSVREVEAELQTSQKATICTRPAADMSADAYLRNFRTMQKIIIAAMQCNLTTAATIMYNDGIGPNRPLASIPQQQHDAAHNNWDALIQINQLQVRLWGELIAGLKAAGILADTVTVLGSNMSDGTTHNAANIPLLVASANVGAELKLGQDLSCTTAITDEAQNRNLADLYVDLFKLYGVQRTFGADKYASTGKPSGILS